MRTLDINTGTERINPHIIEIQSNPKIYRILSRNPIIPQSIANHPRSIPGKISKRKKRLYIK